MIALILAAGFLAALWAIVLGFGLPTTFAALGTAAVCIVLALVFAYRKYRADKASSEIERSLKSQAKQFQKRIRPDQQAEAQALSQEFDKALQTLKGTKLAKGKNALYALPWYVIVGPPGSGKSTAIRQSGLKFPMLGSKGSVRGIGGTRNCDWWLSNEAVLLDTAGRYATEEDDRDEWFSFLEMLKRARPKQPLNGLIVAISIAELATADEAGIEQLAQKIRERVEEVMARLELILPVYILFTKCDLLSGFVESFEDLRKTERNQVFGFTFPVSQKGDLAARAEEQWTRLVQVVERRAVLQMSEARGREARQKIYAFPQQLEALRGQVVSFLAASFVDNVYQDAPLVRGVYLTSGTQEGSPIDRIMAAMAAGFGLSAARSQPAPRADTKSYFLGDLFNNVMFPDQGLVVRNAANEMRLRWLRAGLAAVMLCTAVGFSTLPVRAYLLNRSQVHDAQRELAVAIGYREQSSEPVPLSVLEPLRTRLQTLSRWETEGAPWSYRMGLYAGDALRPHLRTYYTSTLRNVLIEPIVRGIAQGLSENVRANEGSGILPSVHDHARLYAWTRSYLLLTSPKNDLEPALDAKLQAELATNLVEAWASAAKPAPSPADLEAMGTHVAAYLELLKTDPTLGFTRDMELVRRARELLARVPTVKLAVDRVVAQIDSLGWDLSLDHVVGASGLPVTATGRIRGAFTRRAWEEHLRDLFSDASLPEDLLGSMWVLENSAQDSSDDTAETRLCAVRSEYFGRYIDEWRSFIGTIRVEEPTDHARAITVLQDLTRGQPPPLERVMRSVAYNAQVGPKQAEKGKAAEAAEKTGIFEKLKETVAASPVAGLLAQKAPCAGGAFLTDRDVPKALQGFFSFGASLDEPAPGAAPQLTSVQVYQEQLTYVRDALQAYTDDPRSSDPLLARLAAARTRARSLIETQEVGWRPRFDALLWPAINGASASSSAALAGEKGSQWCTSVVLPFGRSLRDRYPFSKQGQDVALADLTEFYKPESGILWSFYESSLKRDVTRVGGRFELQSGANVGAMYTGELTRFLNRSQTLSNVLFAPRAEKPRVEFEVRVRPSPGIAQVLITIDGQLIDFHNGPEKWIRIVWPGEAGKPGAQMRVKGASIDETLTQDGEWGLFRLLDKGTISASPGERFFTARFRLHTQNDVAFDVRPARAENPFVGERAYLEAFRSEGVLVPRAIVAGAKACAE